MTSDKSQPSGMKVPPLRNSLAVLELLTRPFVRDHTLDSLAPCLDLSVVCRVTGDLNVWGENEG